MLSAEKAPPEAEKLRRANDFFNRRLIFDDDIAIWGQTDYWAEGRRRGLVDGHLLEEQLQGGGRTANQHHGSGMVLQGMLHPRRRSRASSRRSRRSTRRRHERRRLRPA